jgi:glycosyltransferase involved in cell wall biosynthesis
VGAIDDHRGVATPVVSVIVPTRDRPALLPTAVESVLEQSLGDVEVVVVDDGSREPVRLAADPRVRVVRFAASRGLAAALNAGAQEARGRWVGHVDDDDRLLPHMVEASLEAIERSALPQPVASLSGVEVVRPDGTVITRMLPPTSPRGSHYSLEPLEPGRAYEVRATLVVERALVLELGGWDEAFRARVRHEFLLRLNPVCSLQGVDRIGYQAVDHGSGPRVSKNDVLKHETLELLVEKHRALFESHGARYAHYLRIDARRLRALGRRREAAASLGRAFRYDLRGTAAWARTAARARSGG